MLILAVPRWSIFQPAQTISEEMAFALDEDAWQPPLPWSVSYSSRIVWDDDVLPVTSVTIVDEDAWQPPLPWSVSPPFLPLWMSEDLPVALDEDAWQPPLPWPTLYVSRVVWDTDILPAILVATIGAFTETGIAATITAQFKVTASVGTFTETGIVAITTAKRTLVGSIGTFIETGIVATVSTQRKLTPAAKGTFTETGVAATVSAQFLLDASWRQARYHLTCYPHYGLDSFLSRALLALIGSVGAFTESGKNAAITAQCQVVALSRAIMVSGRAAGLSALLSRSVTAQPSAFTVIGGAAVFVVRRNPAITLRREKFLYTGIDATLRIARKEYV